MSTNRAAIYVRVSTRGQEDEGTSLDTQEAECRAYAAEHGYNVAQVFREVFSGVELWDRPQLTTMREAVRRREFDVVIAYAIERVARDPVHLGVALSEAEHAGVPVLFVSEPLDDSPEGQLIRFVRGYATKVEHLKIVERTQRGRRARLDSGRPHPSNRPLYGYTWADPSKGAKDQLVEKPEEAAIVRRIFREAAAGKPFRAIANGLTADGVPCRNGQRGRWLPHAIGMVLRHPEYLGESWANRYTYSETHAKRERPRDEWRPMTEGLAPALVDGDLWHAANAMRERHRRESPRRNANPERFLLRAGHIVCGVCGWSMAGVNNNHGGRGMEAYYICSRGAHREGCRTHTIASEPLDAAVWQHLVRVLTDPAVLDAEVERLTAAPAVAADKVAVERGLAAVRSDQQNILEAVSKTAGRAQDLLLQKLATLEAQETALLRELETVAARQAQQQALRERATLLRDRMAALLATPDDVAYANRRLALDMLRIVVRVWPRGHAPRWVIEGHLPEGIAHSEYSLSTG